MIYYFILGTLFSAFFLPLIESFGDAIMSLIAQTSKYICTYLAVKTYKQEKLCEEPEEVHTNAIGFQYEPQEEYYEEEEE